MLPPRYWRPRPGPSGKSGPVYKYSINIKNKSIASLNRFLRVEQPCCHNQASHKPSSMKVELCI